MATAAAHTQQANHNQTFLSSINQATFPDWVVTVAFYKSVHIVESLLARKAISSGSHLQRNNILKRKFATVWREYRPLYNQSRVARYFCVTINATDVAQAIVRMQAVETTVAAIP